MHLSIIVARAQNGVIGTDNQLPWHLPDDLKFFKKHTTGKPIIMGRKTYESIGRPLPKRTNIVITRNPEFTAEGVTVVQSLEEAVAVAKAENNQEVFIIGGAQIYQLALQQATKLYLTEVRTTLAGEARFPEVSLSEWQETFREHHPADEKHQYAFDWLICERKG